MFLWEQQRLAGRLPRGGAGDPVLLPLAQGGHRPLSRAQSSPAAPASLPTPEPPSQARVLPSSETPTRTLPFTTGKARLRGQEEGAGGTQGQGTSPRLSRGSLGAFLEATEHFLSLDEIPSVHGADGAGDGSHVAAGETQAREIERDGLMVTQRAGRQARLRIQVP